MYCKNPRKQINTWGYHCGGVIDWTIDYDEFNTNLMNNMMIGGGGVNYISPSWYFAVCGFFFVCFFVIYYIIIISQFFFKKIILFLHPYPPQDSRHFVARAFRAMKVNSRGKKQMRLGGGGKIGKIIEKTKPKINWCPPPPPFIYYIFRHCQIQQDNIFRLVKLTIASLLNIIIWQF